MNILSAENITKTYGEKTLFKNISFSITDLDKIGIIGVNGTGKSSLLQMIAGNDTPESGSITIPNGIQIEYLSQNPILQDALTILEQVFKYDTPVMRLLQRYESTLAALSLDNDNVALQKQLSELSGQMDALNAWELESQVKIILTKLGVTDFNKKIGTLSGGQKKRVSLASSLISPCDLLILDEPTNHMDNEIIDWLENYLVNRKGALLMVTHDRYFLDRVVNKTFELDKGNLYVYTGNYSNFIEKKLERQQLESILEQKNQNLYKKELDWIRAGAKARSTKQKARIQRFEALDDGKGHDDPSQVEISLATSRLGRKVIEMNHVSKKFDHTPLIKDFSHIVVKSDRIGIIGQNGIGKSTLLNMIAGNLTPNEGSIDIGSTVNIAYFSQESEDMDPNLRAIEYIKTGAEYIQTLDGTRITASQMMEKFLFPPDIQWVYISKLSGGEKRRLYLLKILMNAPNVLILDEPTNDLDIDTLKVLENYIDDFAGAVITVSHDRYFLDRICTKILSFEGQGIIRESIGNYSDFSVKKQAALSKKVTTQKSTSTTNQKVKTEKLKFTYREQQEFDHMDSEIEALENKLVAIEKEIQENQTDFIRLQSLVEEKDELEEALLEKMERQEILNDLNEAIKNQKNLASS